MAEDIKRIKKTLERMARTVREDEKKTDDFKQYGGCNCIILYSCKNVPTNENHINFETFVVNNRLALDCKIKSFDTDICPILPSRKEESKSPIIIKFVRQSVRDLIYHNK